MKTLQIVRVRFFLFQLCVLLAGSAGATNYTLTLTAQGSGTIYRNPTNSSYPAGVTVTITGVANAGWYFANWTGDTNSSLNPLNVVVNSNMNVTGNFVEYPTYALLLATNGEGTIGLSPSGGTYLSNTVVTATGTAAAGWVFAGWSGATNSTVNPVSLAVNANGTLTGTFAELPVFDVEPVSVTNRTGSTVSFTSHAVGTGLLSYQWHFSGGTVGSVANNATLGLTNANTSEVGNYWVVVTNNYGSATSLMVSLTLTNSLGPTNLVNAPSEANLVAAIQTGGWIGIQYNGILVLTNTITITNNVVLDGTGYAAEFSGNNAVQLFYVANNASLTISNLTLANGMCLVSNAPSGTPAQGGAIYNNGGVVALVACKLTNNAAQSLISNGVACGGALFNNGGAVSVYDSVITSNSVVGGSLNVPLEFTSINCAGLGGALYNTNGTVVISGSIVSGNFAYSVFESAYYGGTSTSMGGAVYQASGMLNVTNTTFAGNGAIGGSGGYAGEADYDPGSSAYGGVVAAMGGNMAMSYCQLVANQAVGGPSPGGMYGGGPAPASGGAIYSMAACSVSDSTLSGNQVAAGVNSPYPPGPLGSGGAICSGGMFTLNRCAIYGNSAQGGSVASDLVAEDFGGNGLGGGIYNAGQFTATNCTIALNSAVGAIAQNYWDPSDAVSGNAMGGGIYNATSATFVAMNLTIASNTCSSPSYSSFPLVSANGLVAGFQIANGNTNGSFEVHNTLIADSGGTNSNAYGPITDVGYNICSDGSASLFGGSSYNYTDPQLAPLGNYGGPTLCMALLSNSPAIDNGDPSDFPATDQRGYIRPFGSGPDMGAYEYGSAPSAVPYVNLNVTSTNVVLTFSAFASHTYYLQGSTNLTTWVNLSTNGPFAVSTYISQTVSKQGGHGWFFRLLMQ